MNYVTKYVIDISDTHHIYFYEISNNVYFGTEEKNDMTELKRISENEYGIYGDFLYCTFNGCIYKTDIKALTTKLMMYDMYNINYLDKCIVATKKEKNRQDTLIKIPPVSYYFENIGKYIVTNTSR